MKRHLFILVLSCMCLTAWCQSRLLGPWSGEIKIGPTSLPLIVNIAENDQGLTVTLDSPAQGAKDIPAEITVNDSSGVNIAIPVIGAKYVGKYSDDMIKGEFSQSGMTFPLNLQRGLPERPQTPKPPYPYLTEEVTFKNPTDGTVLHGTLTLPVSYMMQTKRKFPAVIMVTGSGLQNRDEEIFRHKPFAVLAHNLALNGIASLRYDDRGFGDSVTDVHSATTATFASDAEAALHYMAHVDRLGPIGILGHSEGGSIAYMLAANQIPDFIVSLAGPAVSGKEILLKQNDAIMLPAYGSETTKDYVEALSLVFDFMNDNPDAKEWEALDEATSLLHHLNPELISNLRLIIASRNPWIDYFLSYDPSTDISNISCPVLALNGTLDMQVDCETNIESLRNLLPDSPNNQISECEGLNHLFQHATNGLPSEYSVIDETFSPEVIESIIAWIKSLPE